MLINAKEKIICAIDTDDLNNATKLIRNVSGNVGGVKLGLEFYTAFGLIGVKEVTKEFNLPVFLDLKLHDIPNTVEKTSTIIKNFMLQECLKLSMLTVHTSGNMEMMKAAAKVFQGTDVKVLGVTVLTSLSNEDLQQMNISVNTKEQAIALAKMAKDAGLAGVVCSGQEASDIRAAVGDDFLLVTPGIRLPSSDVGDQKRVATPGNAIKAGADYLVIGRDITTAENPVEAIGNIASQIQTALDELAEDVKKKGNTNSAKITVESLDQAEQPNKAI